MAQTSARIIRPSDYVSPTRRTVMGSNLFGNGIRYLVDFFPVINSDMKTTFVLYPGGSPVVVADWVFRTKPILDILAFLAAAPWSVPDR